MSSALKKMFLSLLAAICVIVSSASIFTVLANVEIWDGTIADSFAIGNGTQDDPYIISTVSELAYLAASVNGGESYEGVYFILANDLYINNIDEQGKIVVQNIWTPIGSGNSAEGFGGIFDGADHKIIGLYTSASGNNKGLFVHISASGSVKNLCISNSLIEGKSNIGTICAVNDGIIYNCAAINSAVNGNTAVGGICAKNNGEMHYCSFSGEISCTGMGTAGGICAANDGLIYRAEVSGAIVASDIAGGICGTSKNTLRECTNKAIVSGNGDSYGGICGETYTGANVERCVNVGSISGDGSTAGICGEAAGTAVTDCYNIGSVTAVNYYAGGICGKSSQSIYTTCFSTGSVNAAKCIGAICGRTADDVFANCYYTIGVATDSRETIQNGIGSETRGVSKSDIEGATTGAESDAMQLASTYIGFDTENIWHTSDGALPQLVSNMLDPGQIAHYHTIKTNTVAVTCESDGYTEHYCTICGKGYVDQEIKSTGHSMVHHAAKEPAVGEIGWYEYDSCENCDYTTYIEIPALPEISQDTSSEEPSRELSQEPSQTEQESSSVLSEESIQVEPQRNPINTATLAITIIAVALVIGIAVVIIALRNRRYKNWR